MAGHIIAPTAGDAPPVFPPTPDEVSKESFHLTPVPSETTGRRKNSCREAEIFGRGS